MLNGCLPKREKRLEQILKGFNATINDLLEVAGRNEKCVEENSREISALKARNEELEREGARAETIALKLTALVN